MPRGHCLNFRAWFLLQDYVPLLLLPNVRTQMLICFTCQVYLRLRLPVCVCELDQLLHWLEGHSLPTERMLNFYKRNFIQQSYIYLYKKILFIGFFEDGSQLYICQHFRTNWHCSAQSFSTMTQSWVDVSASSPFWKCLEMYNRPILLPPLHLSWMRQRILCHNKRKGDIVLSWHKIYLLYWTLCAHKKCEEAQQQNLLLLF